MVEKAFGDELAVCVRASVLHVIRIRIIRIIIIIIIIESKAMFCFDESHESTSIGTF
jgi:hypothetical protein